MQFNIKGFITSKKGELYSDCRDNYDINEGNHKVAISDGVSKSFFPGIWSELLVSNYVDSKDISIEELLVQSQEKWLSRVNEIVSKPNVKWFTKNAYNRKTAGLATFVGLQFFEEEKRWEAIALGDSFLFFLPEKYENFEKRLTKLSSKPEPIVFDNFPDYFSSYENGHNGEIRKVEGKVYTGTFYLMTDALSEWFLNEKEGAVEEVSKWENQNQFQEFVNLARENGKLTNDDSAILIINVIEDENPGFNYNVQVMSELRDLIKVQDLEREKKALGLQNQNQAGIEPIQREVEPETIQEEFETIHLVENFVPQPENSGIEPEEIIREETAIARTEGGALKSAENPNPETDEPLIKDTKKEDVTKEGTVVLNGVLRLFKNKGGEEVKSLTNITDKF